MATSKIVFLGGRLAESIKLNNIATKLYIGSSRLGEGFGAAYRLGAISYTKKEWAQASKHFKNAAKFAPNHAPSYFKVGMAAFRQKKWGEAEQFMQKAVELDPSQKKWCVQLAEVQRRQKKWQVAEKTEQKTQPLDINKGSSEALKRAKSFISKKQWHAAEQSLKHAIFIDPENAALHSELGNVLENIGRIWEATDAYRNATLLSPKKADWQYKYATLLQKMNRFDEAESALREAILLMPKKPEWHYKLGHILELLGKKNEAALSYDYAAEYDSSKVAKDFGPAVYHAKRGAWREAASHCLTKIEENTQSAELYFRLGFAYDRQYLWKQAAESYEKALTMDASNADWHFRLGFVFERMENWENAAKSYFNAILRKETYESYWYYRLAYVLSRTGKLKEAAEWYVSTKRHQKISPGNTFNIFGNNTKAETFAAYSEYCKCLPTKANTILYDSAEGPAETVSLFAVFKHLSSHPSYHGWFHTWILNEKETAPEDVRKLNNIFFVSRGSDLHLRNLASAEYLISDGTFSSFLIKKHDQVHISTAERISDDEISNELSIALTAYAREKAMFSEEGIAALSSPELIVAYAKLAEEYSRVHLWEKAAALLQTAIEKDATSADSHYKLGRSFEAVGDWTAAACAYQAAVARMETYTEEWYYRLGYVLNKTGNYAAACNAFKESRIRKLPYGIDAKKYIGEKEFEAVSIYTEYSDTLEIKQNVVLYESYLGSAMSCNPLAIFKFLLDRPDYANYLHVWVVNEKNRILDEFRHLSNVVFVKKDSDGYLRYLASAKYLVNNVTFPYYFIRRRDQQYLNTWHGTPLKTLGHDIKSPFFDHKNTTRNFLHATHLISPNRHTTNIILDKYSIRNTYAGRFAETGYPRNDFVLNTSHSDKEALLSLLGVQTGEKVVLYAPTWRGTMRNRRFDTKQLQDDIISLKEMNCKILFRGHHVVEKILEEVALNVTVVPPDIETNVLLSVVDILITDYSSIFFDFIVTGRPIIYYVYDLEDYQNERGLYFSMEEMPGEICRDIVQLKHALKKQLRGSAEANLKHADYKEQFCSYDDGNATARTVAFFFGNDTTSDLQISNVKRKNILFFAADFMPNGITTSAVNLINMIDREMYQPILVIESSSLEKHPERLALFSKINDEIPVLSRVGRMNMTIEERWVREKFDNEHDLSSENLWAIYKKSYEREYVRIFGNAKFDAIVNFDGYSRFWGSIFAFNRENIPKVIYQHNDMSGEWKLKFPILEGLFRLYGYYDRMISVSQSVLADNVANIADVYNICASKFDYCNNPIDAATVKALATEEIEEDVEQLFANPGSVNFINIGRMSPEKDQGKLIRAFAKVRAIYPAAQLFILGQGPLRQNLEQMIGLLGLEKAVYLLGQKSNPFKYVKAADCFVLSSNHEGQGLVLLEALCLDKPVISTDVAGPRSVLEGGYGCLVENNEEGLVNGMVDFLKGRLSLLPFDPELYQEEAMQMFSEKVCDSLLKPGFAELALQ